MREIRVVCNRQSEFHHPDIPPGVCVYTVSDVTQTLPLYADKEQTDVVGDLAVCLDGMQVDPAAFASAEANNNSESLSLSSYFYLLSW